MKMRTFALLLLATVASSLAAMPTKQELKQVEGLVQELMRKDIAAMNAMTSAKPDAAACEAITDMPTTDDDWSSTSMVC